VLRQVRQIALPTALAMTLSAGAALADPLPLRPVLTLEAARTVLRAAEAKAFMSSPEQATRHEVRLGMSAKR
jgi:glc operon protein GlcG